MKNPHPSGRPIRSRHIKPVSRFNYPPDPSCIYATPRLRPKLPVSLVDAIGYLRVEAGPGWDGDFSDKKIGFR